MMVHDVNDTNVLLSALLMHDVTSMLTGALLKDNFRVTISVVAGLAYPTVSVKMTTQEIGAR